MTATFTVNGQEISITASETTLNILRFFTLHAAKDYLATGFPALANLAIQYSKGIYKAIDDVDDL